MIGARSIGFAIVFLVAGGCDGLTGGPAAAQDFRFFRIGTGGVDGTYYPVGAMLANIISNPPGSRPCDRGGPCGVPGLVAVAQSSNGSVANVKAIEAGHIESGFTQSDVATWAYEATGVFKGKPPLKRLRAIAALYPESVHLVARTGSGIATVSDLKGRRVSLDEPGSGTLVDARLILEAFGLRDKDLKAEYVKPGLAVQRMREGALDAFFIVAGYPTAAVSELTAAGRGYLVAIDGPRADKLRERQRFFAVDEIPLGTYGNLPAVRTLSVKAIWVVSSTLSEELVHAVTKALWGENARRLLDEGHAKGAAIRRDTALDGIAIPLHPGAARYYREAGMELPADGN